MNLRDALDKQLAQQASTANPNPESGSPAPTVTPPLPKPRAADYQNRMKEPGVDYATEPNSIVIQVRGLDTYPVGTGKPIVLPFNGDLASAGATIDSGMGRTVQERGGSFRESLIVVTGADGRVTHYLTYNPAERTVQAATRADIVALREGRGGAPESAPETLYHQTASKDEISSFAKQPGRPEIHYFSTRKDVLKQMINSGASKDVTAPTKAIKVEVTTKRPLDLRKFQDEHHTPSQWLDILRDAGVTIPQDVAAKAVGITYWIPAWQLIKVGHESLRSAIIAAGYDGIRFNEWGGTTTAVFSGDQVKIPSTRRGGGKLSLKPKANESGSTTLPEIIAEGAGKGRQLGIVAPGTVELQRAIEALMPPERGNRPLPVIDTSTPLPDLQPHEVSKQIFSQGWGAENIPVLGKLFGGRFNAKSPIQKAVATWYAERFGVGKAIASAMGAELNGKVRGVFSADANGDLNVVAPEGVSRKISDVFEALQTNADAYTLTPEQRAVWDETIQPLLARLRTLVDQYGLVNVSDGEEDGAFKSYFPRIVTEIPESAGGISPGTGGGKVGSKAFFQKQRAWTSEAEGWAHGYKYETDVEARLVKSAERLYKAMADKRLASDPDLGGRTRAGLLADLAENYSEELTDGTMTDEAVARIADGIESKGRVYQPGFAGKIFPVEVAETLNKSFPGHESSTRRWVVTVNNFAKALALGFDLGAAQIQGINLLLSSSLRPDNARIWAKAQWHSMKALANPDGLSDYVRANAHAVRELAQLGSPVGALQEMLGGLEKSEPVRKIPIVGELGRRFSAQFTALMDVSRVELWKSWREVAPQNEWPQVVQAIESVMGGGRMESIGLSPGRVLAERALLLAPSYYRGGVNLIGGVAERGVSGHIARQTMAGYLFGGAVLFAAVAAALDMDDEEIQRRMSPMDRNFLSWRIPLESGREINMGIGGIHKSLIRLFGKITQTSIEHPENWKSLAPNKNPIVQWLRGHSSPVVGFAWDGFSGRDYLGRTTDVSRAGESLLPIWLRSTVSKVEKVPPLPTEIAISFFGLSVFGMTPEQQMSRLASEFKREQGVTPRTGSVEESPFSALEWAMRTNQTDKAKQEFQTLLKTLEGTPGTLPPRHAIFEHFNRLANTKFTGSLAREAAFYKSLTAQQKAIYEIAARNNRALPGKLREAAKAD